MYSFHCVVVTTFALTALASSGDGHPAFQGCLSQCNASLCQSSSTQPYSQPLSLWITRWTCEDDCKYACMHWAADSDIEDGSKVQQYYGKWPFIRFAGMQEPASVAFSLLNLWFHAKGFQKVQKSIPDGHPMKSYYIMWSIISINSWGWSSVFHTRDLPFTEKMDYFSAALAILCALYYTVIRLFHIYPVQPRDGGFLASRPSANNVIRKLWSAVCIVAYLAHISYLTLLPRFDYTYNIIFNLVLGLTHNALWLIYSLPSSMSLLRRFPSKPKSYRPPFVNRPAILAILTMAATMFELFDFPPWHRIIDAHALWHLSTAPLVMFLYDFLIEDALDEGWREQKV